MGSYCNLQSQAFPQPGPIYCPCHSLFVWYSHLTSFAASSLSLTITDTCAPFLSASTRTSAITACYLCHFLFCLFHLPLSLSLSSMATSPTTTTTTTVRSSSVPSLPPPSPKSPPEYPDLYGKRRETARVHMLEREITFLEEELKSVEGLQAASRCCKEIADYNQEEPSVMWLLEVALVPLVYPVTLSVYANLACPVLTSLGSVAAVAAVKVAVAAVFHPSNAAPYQSGAVVALAPNQIAVKRVAVLEIVVLSHVVAILGAQLVHLAPLAAVANAPALALAQAVQRRVV
ncbi:Guanine nucleotide-binding protein subunit gamma 3 [Glycine max]|nr:Guanine nucleotide-binding protein subunit gamma 3 [Glycine max]